jgi:muramoyltetrapeptide carboxypeptidase
MFKALLNPSSATKFNYRETLYHMKTHSTAISIIKAKKLSSGFGIVSPGGPLSKERTELGYQTISSLGFSFSSPLEPFSYYADYTHEFTNGSAKERINSIKESLADSSNEVLLASRGVTGSLEIISEFPFELLKTHRKLLIGQSDITSFLVQTPFRSGLPSIHGPTLGAEFADYNTNVEAKESVDLLIQMITNPDFTYSVPGENLKKGSPSEGRLLAGNLTTLAGLLGTPFDVNYSDCILVIEDVGEAPYRIKRMLFQLYLAGKFSKLAGLCFGRFAKCESRNGPDTASVISTFAKNQLAHVSYPVLAEIPVGHWGKSVPIPIGCKALIKDGLLCILENPVT